MLIRTVMGIFKMIFCRHKTEEFIRNIYGDEVNRMGGRSLWKCKRCGKYIVKDELCLD